MEEGCVTGPYHPLTPGSVPDCHTPRTYSRAFRMQNIKLLMFAQLAFSYLKVKRVEFAVR